MHLRSLPYWVLLLLAIAAAGRPIAAQGLNGPTLRATATLPAETIHPGDTFPLSVSLAVPPGMHINAHQPSESYLIPTSITFAATSGVSVGTVRYPKAQSRRLSFTTKPLAVYAGTVTFTAPISIARTAKPGQFLLKGSVRTQACSDQACFPPQNVPFAARLTITAAGKTTAVSLSGSANVVSVPGKTPQPVTLPGSAAYPRLTGFVPPQEFLRWLDRGVAGQVEPESRLGSLLHGGNWLLALPLIFLAGLALNLTPCVYPLIPITIGFFSGQGSGNKRRVLTLAALYVLGMAVMYSALGVAAALTGQLFGSQLQNPYVLIVFALVMSALALSMFGVWEIRLPTGLTSRVAARAGYAGALVMGLLVGFVAAPCIGPAVVALLQVVGQKANPVLGFAVFFALAVGLGTPYLILGASTGLLQRLPRSGEWLNAVKRVFGLVLFGMALYYLGPVLGQSLTRWILSLYTLGAGAYLLLLDGSGRAVRRLFLLKRILGAIAVLIALRLFLPAAKPAQRELHFEAYNEAKIAQARREGRPVLIDFRADWCAACKELEARTFRDPRVITATRGMLLLQKDLTRWEGADAARLRQEYGIAGLPNVVLIPPAAQHR